MNAFGGESQFSPHLVGNVPYATADEREANLEYVRAKTEQIKLENAKLHMDVKDLESSPDEAQVYPFFGDIDPVSAARFIQTTSMWSRRAPLSDITIILNSGGGSVFSGLGVYDHIMGLRRLGHKVTIKVLSISASMAAVILQAGSERYIGSNALLLLHEGEGALSGSMADIEDSNKMFKMLGDRTALIVSERSGMTVRKYKALIKRRDKWLTAQEALDLGLVDGIDD